MWIRETLASAFLARSIQFLVRLCLAMKIQYLLNNTIENTTYPLENVSTVPQSTTMGFSLYSVPPSYPQEFLIYLQKLQTPPLVVDIFFICMVKSKN